ncbi:DUF5808 domain-containing protein [Spongiactinospora sp. TRM90649]|uniref:DUF1648 domain-containing protein n=1 Tax=Spongiactinospora sp. TRM90649 TaxID=3031114 RepID=UPI0023F8C7E7|nr:DUF5808 domain-containing protein [Spongiactinospora sp. TRM90649]MDF5755498.1 DUF5808 domain-containing protein [Spongiactinospora sp. TRM90649]
MSAFLSGMASVAVIACVALITPALARPTLPFGVRVPYDRVADPAVVAQRRAYARLVLLAGGVAAILSAVLAAAVTTGSGRLIAVEAVFGVSCALLYYRAHRTLRAAKRSGGWHEGRRQGVTVDTTFRTDPVRLPWPWLLPAVAITLTTAALGWYRYDALPPALPALSGLGVEDGRTVPTTPLTAFEPVLLQAAITLLLPALTLVLLRARPDLDAARPRGSARKYRVYLRGMARMSLLGAACFAFCLLIAALRLWGLAPATTAWLVATYLPPAAPVIGALVWELRAGQGGHRLPSMRGEESEDSGLVQRDDDRHWFLAGAVYANRRDPAIAVPARFGTTWTLNLGHPVTWSILAVLAIVLLLWTAGVIDLPTRTTLS